MMKIATIAALAMIAPQVMGQCAGTNNWIAADLGLTATGDGSNAVNTPDTTILTCVTQKTDGSCCTKANIATFQTEADTLVDTLKTAVSTRDKYILDRRGDVLAVKDSLSSIESSLTSLGTSATASLSAFLTPYESIIEAFTNEFAALKTGFVTLQENRVDCFNALIKAQVTIWCSACSEAMTGLDTATSTVTFGSVFNTYLAGECSAYVASAVEQSGILSLYAVADYFAALASALQKLVDGDAEGAATEISAFLADYLAVTTPTAVLQQAASAPTTCTTTSCDWASSLLSTGALDTNTATVGGVLPSRRLQEVPAGRMLQVNDNPSTESAGITVAFPTNPGNVDNDQNSAVRNGAIACAITALAALF